MDAVKQEMKNVCIAFEEYEGDVSTLVGYTQITGHIVFDVKLGENLRRIARYYADGHKTGRLYPSHIVRWCQEIQ
jgi:hypothetical protein